MRPDEDDEDDAEDEDDAVGASNAGGGVSVEPSDKLILSNHLSSPCGGSYVLIVPCPGSLLNSGGGNSFILSISSVS